MDSNQNECDDNWWWKQNWFKWMEYEMWNYEWKPSNITK